MGHNRAGANRRLRLRRRGRHEARLAARRPTGRTMYRVEKFTPTACPHCARPFRQQDADWTTYMGRVENGRKVPDPEWPRVVCAGCDALVKIIRLEDRQVGDRAEAERLVREDGFCNLMEVRAVGNMARDFRVVHAGPPRLVVIEVGGERG